LRVLRVLSRDEDGGDDAERNGDDDDEVMMIVMTRSEAKVAEKTRKLS